MTELIKSHTPSGQNYALRIPTGTKDRFLAQYAKLPKEKYSPPKIDSYYVKSGDTLSGIAAKFRVSVNSLVDENGIRNRHRLRVGQWLRIPGRGALPGNSHSAIVSKLLTGEITYIIKKKDTLYEIALKYNVSYRDIMLWNNIKNHRKIRPGQKIIIKTK